jgi:hypothetical protein
MQVCFLTTLEKPEGQRWPLRNTHLLPQTAHALSCEITIGVSKILAHEMYHLSQSILQPGRPPNMIPTSLFEEKLHVLLSPCGVTSYYMLPTSFVHVFENTGLV